MSDFTIQGIVFDVDGVLFDTEVLTQVIWNEVSGEMGWPQVGENYLSFVGQSRTDIRQKMLDMFGSQFPQEEFFLACSQRSHGKMERDGIPVKPGVVEILDFLHSKGIPLALATSTGREHTMLRMELTGLGSYFAVIVTGDDVVHSKPHPEIYALACEQLGTTPQHTLAIEDSRNGILSAHGAGMRPVMIPDLIQPDEALSPLLFEKFDSLADLQVFLSQH